MEYMTIDEAANKWGISNNEIQELCYKRKIENAAIIKNVWFIPIQTNNPTVNNQSVLINKNTTIKPFLKWAGGKGQLLTEICKYFPFDKGKITKYAEPFVGGGAVFFDILNNYDLDEIYISDINDEVINTYKIIQNHCTELINKLKKLQDTYLSLDIQARKLYYLQIREQFNSIEVNNDDNNNITKASLMIFLNKTCFNGLYRVNKKGLFNVPMGSYKNPLICDEKNLQLISKKLSNVIINCSDYKQSSEFIDNKTFVYFDPPYRPITNTSNFTAYSEYSFTDTEQKELANFVNKINDLGAKFLLSNSDPKNINTDDDFFDKLYSPYNIKRIEASRMINCNSEARGKIKELLISNY